MPSRQPRGYEMRPWNKGGCHTEETGQKISRSTNEYNATPEGKAKIERLRRKKYSKETKQRISEALKAYYASPAGKATIAARPPRISKGSSDEHLIAVRAHSPLTQEDVLEIRKRYAEGNITQTALAGIFSVHSTTIHYIVQYKTWKKIIA